MILDDYINSHFGVDSKTFLQALLLSPGSQGYIFGAISELILSTYLREKGYEVLRIKEKPAGGNKAKADEARGDFYFRKKGSESDKWYVLEIKGLKSNSEFRGSKLDNKTKLYNFLKNIAFGTDKAKIYSSGLRTYDAAKQEWELQNSGKKFPPFNWTKEDPGPLSCDLSKLWRDEHELKEWVAKQSEESFKEESYRKLVGPIRVLETHKPSTRICSLTGIKQAAPLVCDFSILAVDLFLRTREHKFVFVNPKTISHSPGSPSHLYQNYTIDILIKGLKDKLVVRHPWYEDVVECIEKTSPELRSIDKTQLDERQPYT